MARKAIFLSIAVIFFFVGIVGIGEHYLWRAMLSYHFRQLSKQVQTILYNEVAQGNLFAISSDLGKLRMSGLIENVGLTQLAGTTTWLYYSSADITRLVGGRRAAIQRCKTGRVATKFTNDDTAIFTFLIGSPGLRENVCVVAESKIPNELTVLRNKVNLVLAIVVSLSIIGLVAAIINMTRNQFLYEKIASEHLKDAAEKLTSFARQISHDIRSPLSALNTAIRTVDLTSAPEETRHLILNATNRINDIANGLLIKSRQMPGADSGSASDDNHAMRTAVNPIHLVPVIFEIINEKKTQLRPSISITAQVSSNCENVMVSVDRSNLLRALSNLINNSIEAIVERGQITIYVRSENNMATISISDTGRGIPQDVITKLGVTEFTYGKTGPNSGFGLGFSFAKQSIENAGGSLAIQSRVGVGTIVNLALPVAHNQA